MTWVIGGMGSISAHGVDVIEGTARSPITITFHDQSVSVTGSSNVVVGNGNTQTLDFEKIITAVNSSTASEAEKGEAKSLIEKLANSPLLQAVLGGISGGG